MGWVVLPLLAHVWVFIGRTQRIKCPFEILMFSAQLSSYGPIQMSKFMKCRDSWVLIFLKAPCSGQNRYPPIRNMEWQPKRVVLSLARQAEAD